MGVNSANSVDDPNGYNAPSSSPYITQVGGTTLTMNGTGASFASETVWNWGGGQGSSGGVSSYYPIPSWQTGISMAANLGSTSQRNIPDVAMNADNVFVYDTQGSPDVLGGTSCAAPLWAGFMALVNQQAASQGQSPAASSTRRFMPSAQARTPAIAMPACFHDTTTGNNFSSGTHHYSAVAGYDLCTGWGTPNGASLINALAGGPVWRPQRFPPGHLGLQRFCGRAVQSKFVGVSVDQCFRLGDELVAWSVPRRWLHVAATNGTLAGYSSASVGVSLTAAANALKPGTYSTSLPFKGLAKQVLQRVAVTLQVNQPLTVSPSQGFTAVGPVGGAFTPDSLTFTLANASASAQSWKLAKTSTATWLTVSASSGALAAGGQTNVTVSLSSAAKALRAAVYSANVTFTESSGSIAVVPFTLSIGQPLVENGGFETGNFTDWTLSGNTESTSVTRGNSFYVHTGNYGVELGPPGSPGYLSQTVTTVSGQAYALSLWLRNGYGSTPNWFQVQWNGTTFLSSRT